MTMRKTKTNTRIGNGILMQNWLSPSLLEIKVGVFLFQSKELRDIINVKLSPVTLVIGLKVSAKVSQLQVILPAPTKPEEDFASPSYENKDSCPTHKTKSCVVNFSKVTFQWIHIWYIFQ